MDLEKLKRKVQIDPETYQYERAERVGVSQTGIGAALRCLGMSRKTNPLTSASGYYRTVCL